MTFGEKLKQIRIERNFSQEELAKILSTSKQVISRYETNKRSPKIDTVSEYAQILDVPLNYLLDNNIKIIPNSLIQSISVIGDNNSGQKLITGHGENLISLETLKDESLSKQEQELIRIYRSISLKSQAKLLSFAYDIEESELK